jgi:hypothetical protein
MLRTCIAITIALAFSSCATRINENRGRILLRKSDTTIAVRTNATSQIKILYTGCGGMAITSGTETILIDPFYTGHGFWRGFLGKIRPNASNTLKMMRRAYTMAPNAMVKAVLVSHSHWDHMEDLPFMLQRGYIPTDAKIIGSRTAECALNGTHGRREFIDADPYMHDPRIKNSAGSRGDSNTGKWLTVSNNFTVLPIRSKHAPHFYLIHAMTCKGCRANCCPTIAGVGTPDQLTKARKWKEGTTYSFLIDVKDGEKIVRLYMQTSSSKPPYGFPPANELKKDSVDLAILCMASYKYVCGYPGGIDTRLRAPQTMIIHWENFFDDMYRPEVKAVVGTNPRGFYCKLRKARKKKGEKKPSLESLQTKVHMVKPGVVMGIDY